jgi:hypothetical protein
MADNLIGQSDDPNQAGVLGEGVTVEAGTGVYGRDRAGKGNGVIGYSEHGRGVWGHTQDGFGLLGESVNGRGVVGSSETAYGVYAHSKKSAGIRGDSDEGRGVEGWAINSEGVVGISTNGNGVWGQTEGAGVGVLGTSANNDGVRGVSTNQNGVSAFGGHTGIYAKAPVNDRSGRSVNDFSYTWSRHENKRSTQGFWRSHRQGFTTVDRRPRVDSDFNRVAVEGESIWEHYDKRSNVNVNAE